MPDEAVGEVVVAEGGAVDQNQAQPQQQQTGWAIAKGMLMRLVVIYMISSFIRSWRQGPEPQQQAVGSAQPPGMPMNMPSRNMFEKHQPFDMYLYFSELEERPKSFDEESDLKLFWKATEMIYGDWHAGPDMDGSFTHTVEFDCPPVLQNNGSLFLHVFVVKSGGSPDPRNRFHDKRTTIHRVRRLNKFKKKRYQKTQNLLTGHTDKSEEEQKKAEVMTSEILNHWHSNLTINLVDDHTTWTKGSLPAPLDEYVKFDPVHGDYQPIFFFNDYWNLGSDYQVLNDTVTSLNLSVTYTPMSLFKWQMYASQQMRSKWSQILGSDLVEDSDDDQDSIKQALIETNPYLLGVTIFVSLLHTVFEFLAFKNDIQFWRSRKSMEGLSVRSVLFNVFTSLIVLLYVLDHDTNFVVKMSIGVGLLIEFWKVPKCMDVKLDRENKIFGIIPRLKISDKGSYVESSTKIYDQMAFRYLSWALYPLLGGYAIYSLMYVEQKGWYSWVLSMLYGFLLTFGFIMMTPQLFINYKLKSVAHLPWRMLSYKFINTFIDDLFAFVIRMPTMYRIGCFRDDIVFFVYLYQRWIYRVDPKRVNEFGTTGEDASGTTPAIEGEANGQIAGTSAADTTDETPAATEETKKEK